MIRAVCQNRNVALVDMSIELPIINPMYRIKRPGGIVLLEGRGEGINNKSLKCS